MDFLIFWFLVLMEKKIISLITFKKVSILLYKEQISNFIILLKLNR